MQLRRRPHPPPRVTLLHLLLLLPCSTPCDRKRSLAAFIDIRMNMSRDERARHTSISRWGGNVQATSPPAAAPAKLDGGHGVAGGGGAQRELTARARQAAALPRHRLLVSGGAFAAHRRARTGERARGTIAAGCGKSSAGAVFARRTGSARRLASEGLVLAGGARGTRGRRCREEGACGTWSGRCCGRWGRGKGRREWR